VAMVAPQRAISVYVVVAFGETSWDPGAPTPPIPLSISTYSALVTAPQLNVVGLPAVIVMADAVNDWIIGVPEQTGGGGGGGGGAGDVGDGVTVITGGGALGIVGVCGDAPGIVGVYSGALGIVGVYSGALGIDGVSVGACAVLCRTFTETPAGSLTAPVAVYARTRIV